MRTRVSAAAKRQRSGVDALVQSIALASVIVGSVGIGVGVAAARAGSPSSASSASSAAQADVRHEYGSLPLSFEPNVGQAAAGVHFIARGTTYSAAFESNSVVMSPRDGGTPVMMRLEGAAAHPAITGGNQLPGVVNYLIGRDRAAWHTNVPTFGDVTYSNVYPGIDMVWHGSQAAPEYDFVVAPGAHPAAIHLSFAGTNGVSIEATTGDLVVSMPNGTMRQHAPSVFQNEPGDQRSVQGRFVITAPGVVGFAVGPYDSSRPLVIDPTLAYSTYLGGSLNDVAYSIAVDAVGDAYVTGSTCSTNFPTRSGPQSAYGGPCPANNPYFSPSFTGFTSTFGAAFVSKLNPEGTALLYSTYLGGSQPSAGFSVAVDSTGDAFVAGETEATDFPTTSNAFNAMCAPITQPGRTHPEAFATVLDSAGSALAYSTCVGGSTSSVGGSIAVHGGRIYLAGQTTDADFPVTANSVQTSKGGVAADFITVINPVGAGSADLVYSTYLGGSAPTGESTGIGIAVDAAGLIYVAGGTTSVDFPVTGGAYQLALANNHTAPVAGSDAYVSKINPAGAGSADLVYSTYLGGPRGTLSTQGNANGSDWATGVALGPPVAGSTVPTIYVTGTTASPMFPTTSGAVQSPAANVFNCSDLGCYGFLSRLNPVGGGTSDLVYSTYLGSNGAPGFLSSVAVNPLNGDAVVAGGTGGTTYPTANAIQPTCGCFTGAGDAVVSEVRPDPTGTPASNLVFSTFLGGTGLDDAMGVAVDGSGSIYVAGATEGTETPAGRKAPPLPYPITPGAIQPTFGGGTVGTAFGGTEPLDAFATKIAFADTSGGLSVSPNPATLNQALTYTVSATNVGPSPVTIIATDSVPKGLKLQSIGAGCTSATVSRVLTVTCVLGPIAPGASAQATLTLKAGKPGSYTNTVTEDGNAVDLTPADNTATVTATVTR